ncbi:MAG: AarF/ABC1/UbiB kinase family protein [Opitutaceae bacterium]|nr:AarF/ABC1/UbiB kinase family protein [Opitutaceae bacterium]
MKPFGWFTNAVRMREIIGVLWRNGFDGFLQKIRPPSGLLRRITPKPRSHHSLWERIRVTLEELGPTFVKFGQILSMRPDAFPEPLIVELQKLQASVTPQPFEEMAPVLQSGINGEDPGEVFSEFDRTPVASASVAQVYYATLRNGGRRVAVKIQRPGIRKKITSDFEILRWLAQQAHQRIEALQPYNLPEIVDELGRGLDEELDFRVEAHNVSFFLERNKDREHVTAPRAHHALSSETVLVMDLAEGTKIRDIEPGSPLARAAAANGATSLFHQILVDGFFHADPHAGNVLIQPGGCVCFLDWGLVGQLTRHMRYTLVDLFEAFLSGDSAQVVRVAMDLERTTTTYPDIRRMEREILYALRETFDPVSGKGEIGRAMLRLLHIFGENGIEIAQDYALVAKAVYTIEETGTRLDPAFSLSASFMPAVKKLIARRRDPKTLLQNFRRTFLAGFSRMQELPAELHRVLRLLESGRATINFQHKGLEDMDDVLNSASNKLTVGLIIAAMIIGSSIIIATKIPPLVGDSMSLLGIVGYALSGLLGLWIVFNILRHK